MKSASKKSRSRKSASKSRVRKSASKKSRSRKSASKKSRSKSNRKPCKSNQVRNQSTKRCRNKSPYRKQCKSNQVRNQSTHRCRNKSRIVRRLRAVDFSAGQPHGIGYVPIPPPRLPHGFMPSSSSLGGGASSDQERRAGGGPPPVGSSLGGSASSSHELTVYKNATHEKELRVIDINSYSSYEIPGKKKCYEALLKSVNNKKDCYVIGIVYSVKGKNIPNDIEIGFGGSLTENENKLTIKGYDNVGYDEACARELQEESQFSVTNIKENRIKDGYWQQNTIDNKGNPRTKVGLTYLIPVNKLKMGQEIVIDKSSYTFKRIDMYVYGTKQEIEDMASRAITKEENVYGFAVIPFNNIMNLPTMTNGEHSDEHRQAVFMCETQYVKEYHYWCDEESGIFRISGIITSGQDKTSISKKMKIAFEYWDKQYAVRNTGWRWMWSRDTSQDRKNAEDFNKSLNQIKYALEKCIEGRTNYLIHCPEYASKDVAVISGHANVISEYTKILDKVQKLINENTELAKKERMKQIKIFLEADKDQKWLKENRMRRDVSNTNYLHLQQQRDADKKASTEAYNRRIGDRYKTGTSWVDLYEDQEEGVAAGGRGINKTKKEIQGFWKVQHAARKIAINTI